MTALQMAVAAVLREALTQRQLSHGDIARASGLSKSTVTRILTGTRPASVGHLQCFAAVLKTPTSRLVAAAEKRL